MSLYISMPIVKREISFLCLLEKNYRHFLIPSFVGNLFSPKCILREGNRWQFEGVKSRQCCWFKTKMAQWRSVLCVLGHIKSAIVGQQTPFVIIFLFLVWSARSIFFYLRILPRRVSLSNRTWQLTSGTWKALQIVYFSLRRSSKGQSSLTGSWQRYKLL